MTSLGFYPGLWLVIRHTDGEQALHLAPGDNGRWLASLVSETVPGPVCGRVRYHPRISAGSAVAVVVRGARDEDLHLIELGPLSCGVQQASAYVHEAQQRLDQARH